MSVSNIKENKHKFYFNQLRVLKASLAMYFESKINFGRDMVNVLRDLILKQYCFTCMTCMYITRPC